LFRQKIKDQFTRLSKRIAIKAGGVIVGRIQIGRVEIQQRDGRSSGILEGDMI
jgi:hypothetical protein